MIYSINISQEVICKHLHQRSLLQDACKNEDSWNLLQIYSIKFPGGCDLESALLKIVMIILMH